MVDNLSKAVNDGSKAERLVNDPTLAQAFENVEQAIYRSIKECPIRDHDGLHELRLMLKLLGDLRANLDQAVRDGKLAAAEIEQKRNPVSYLGDLWPKTSRPQRFR